MYENFFEILKLTNIALLRVMSGNPRDLLKTGWPVKGTAMLMCRKQDMTTGLRRWSLISNKL